MSNTIQHPDEIEWNEAPMPDVHDVPRDCALLLWVVYESNGKWHEGSQGKEPKNDILTEIVVTHPQEDKLNPLYWNNGHMKWHGSCSFQCRVKYWAWINKGTSIIL